MTTSPETDPDLIGIPAPLPTCAACPHPLDEHDPIGVRFCSITTARGIDRGCACATA